MSGIVISSFDYSARLKLHRAGDIYGLESRMTVIRNCTSYAKMTDWHEMNDTDNFRIRLLTGTDATDAFLCNKREQMWRELCASSPSATVFQGPDFAHAWWQAYGDIASLAIAEAFLAHDTLLGQLILVRSDHSGWAAIGVHQSEYPAVLSRADDPLVVSALLKLARRELGIGRMRFVFLPPHSPVQGYLDGCFAANLHPHKRPLRRFKDAAAPGKRSRGKHTRLKKMGARYELLREPEKIVDFLEEFIPLYDERQSAMGYGVPFRNDPRKQEFLAALAAEAGLLHAATMRIDNRLIAAIIGIPNGSHLVLGLPAHDPTFDDLSPITVLIHELGALYTGTEIDTLDLTPGGAYKDRFATECDTAYAIDVSWSPHAVAEVLARRCAGPIVRRIKAYFAQ